MDFLVPKIFPQILHGNGSSSTFSSFERALSDKLNWGNSEITFSGHVLTQIPHWIHASSLKSYCGVSGLSWSAPEGQALTHDKHRVHPSLSILTLP